MCYSINIFLRIHKCDFFVNIYYTGTQIFKYFNLFVFQGYLNTVYLDSLW